MLGEKLKDGRKRLGLSQEDLAEKLSVSRQLLVNGKVIEDFLI